MTNLVDKTEGNSEFIFQYIDMLSRHNDELMKQQSDLLQSFLALRIRMNELEKMIKDLGGNP